PITRAGPLYSLRFSVVSLCSLCALCVGCPLGGWFFPFRAFALSCFRAKRRRPGWPPSGHEDGAAAAAVADVERLAHVVLLADADQLVVGGAVVVLDRFARATAHREEAGVVAGGETPGGFHGQGR